MFLPLSSKYLIIPGTWGKAEGCLILKLCILGPFEKLMEME